MKTDIGNNYILRLLWFFILIIAINRWGECQQPQNPANANQNPQRLFFTSIALEPFSNSDFTGFDDLLAQQLFRRLGITIVIARVPAQRALINLNNGVDDGMLSRIGGLNQNFPNLVQFNESVRIAEFVAFSHRSDINISDWSDLAPYDVAFITGWKIAKNNIGKPKSITKTRNIKQLLLLLEHKRVDIVITNKVGGLWLARKMQLKNMIQISQTLARVPLYFYLHRKHRNLLPRADAMLKTMKQDGTWLDLHERIIAPVLNQL